MSRYIERAENIARMVDVNIQLLLDFREVNDAHMESHWLPIVQATGDDELFLKLHPRADSHAVCEFYTFDPGNPNSLVACISAARENARMVRDQITLELWEEINRLYLFLQSERAREMWLNSAQELYYEFKALSLHVQGLANATIPHTEGWQFMQVGKYLERADKTSRILDIRYRTLPERGAPPATLGTREAIEWAAVLRSCSAWDAYRQIHGADIGPRRVAELLLLDEDFPRSVEFCMVLLDSALRRISGAQPGRFSKQPEKLSGRLAAELQFSSIDEIFERGLHDYIDALQTRLNQIGEALFETYIAHTFDAGVETMQQQQ
jgi:uncharacterized alpha-E superfamily protein